MYVELKHINKHFGNFKASDDVTVGIEKGKLIGLLGPSGSGKTTILRMIAGLENPDSGEIIIDGKVINNVPASKRGIGFVFQSYALFRYMTVFDNVAFGLKIAKKPANEIKERVHSKNVTPANFRAGSASVWPLPERLHPTRNCSCLTNPLPQSTRRCVRNCAAGSRA